MWTSTSRWQINVQTHQLLNSQILFNVWNLPADLHVSPAFVWCWFPSLSFISLKPTMFSDFTRKWFINNNNNSSSTSCSEKRRSVVVSQLPHVDVETKKTQTFFSQRRNFKLFFCLILITIKDVFLSEISNQSNCEKRTKKTKCYFDVYVIFSFCKGKKKRSLWGTPKNIYILIYLFVFI